MIWRSHRIVTGSFIFALTGNFVAALSAVSGSVFPDSLEMTCPFIRHRTVGHWWLPYAVLMVLIFSFILKFHLLPDSLSFLTLFRSYDFSSVGVYIFANCIFWFLAGCICHIAEDSLTGYVPLWRPRDKKIHFRKFYTGSPKEDTFVFFWVIMMFCVVFLRFFTGHFSF